MFTIEFRIRNHEDAGTQKVKVTGPEVYQALLQQITQQFPDIAEDYNLLMATTPSVSLDLYGGQTNQAQNGTPIDIEYLKVYPYSEALVALIQKILASK